jgi:hypothetical protein
MVVKIYIPTRNPMQSGNANAKKWHLEYDAVEDERFIDPVMGWTGNANPNRQLRLVFDTQEEAIAYAVRKRLEYKVIKPKETKKIIKAYADNFK